MQHVRYLQIGSRYAIRGKEVIAVQIRSLYGIGLRIVTLRAGDGDEYKLNQWHDGAIYRISKVRTQS